MWWKGGQYLETLNLVYLPLLFNQPPPLPDKEGVLMYGSKFTQKPRFENRDSLLESFPDIPLLPPASKKAKLTKFKIKFVFCIQRPKNLFMFLLIFWRVKKCYMWYTNESRWDQRRCSRTPLENIIERLFHLDYSRYFRDFSLGRWL